MTFKSQFLLTLLTIFCSDQLIAQAIAGSWTGFLTTAGSTVDYEVLIKPDLTGYSMTSFDINGRQNSGIKVIGVHQKTNTFILSDGDLIFNDYSSPTRRVKLIAMLMLRPGSGGDTLTGKFVTKSLDYRSNGSNEFSGIVTLYRHTKFDSTKLVTKLVELHLYGGSPPALAMQQNRDSTTIAPAEIAVKRTVIKSSRTSTRVDGRAGKFGSDILGENVNVNKIGPRKPAADLALRKTEVLRTIPFYADSLVLTLYDNGIVDGDTVSVVLNQNVIIPRQGLTENAYRVVIPIPREMGDSLRLVMYAENLGSIPPNTGLLIIEDGGARYEVRFEGDLQKSSAIILLRKHGN